MINEKRIAEIEALGDERVSAAITTNDLVRRRELRRAIRDLLAERLELVGVLYGFKVVVNSYIPPGTIVMHADEAECMRVWRENQKPEPLRDD